MALRVDRAGLSFGDDSQHSLFIRSAVRKGKQTAGDCTGPENRRAFWALWVRSPPLPLVWRCTALDQMCSKAPHLAVSATWKRDPNGKGPGC